MIEQRRRILRAAGLAAVPFVPVGALALASAAVQAQPGWPAKPITLISPIAAALPRCSSRCGSALTI